MAGREGIGEGISSTENRPHGPSTSTTGKGELAEPRDTPRSRGRLGWDTWREKRAHPYANAAVARTTKQAHAHRQNACSQFLCPSLKDSTPRAVPRRSGVQSLQWCSLNASQLPLNGCFYQRISVFESYAVFKLLDCCKKISTIRGSLTRFVEESNPFIDNLNATE